MPQFRHVPWRSREDLLRIRGYLYSDTIDRAENREGVDTVRAWKARGHLPHLIESTALLVDAASNDTLPPNDTISPWSVRAVYSLAVARFVTSLLDAEQTAKSKRSMHSIAAQLELPLFLVEIRHQVTHEELPSLEVLRFATQSSLSWLWGFYWINLERNDVDEEDRVLERELERLKEHFRSLLRAYVRQELEGATAPSNAKRKKSAAAVDTLVAQLLQTCDGHLVMLQHLAVVFCEKKILFPSTRSLGEPLDKLFELWNPVLLQLCSAQLDFFQLLTSQLVLQLAGSGTTAELEVDTHREAVFCWIEHILKARKEWTFATSDYVRHIMQQCLSPDGSSPNVWTLRLAQSVLDDAELSTSGIREDWSEMVKMAQDWIV